MHFARISVTGEAAKLNRLLALLYSGNCCMCNKRCIVLRLFFVRRIGLQLLCPRQTRVLSPTAYFVLRATYVQRSAVILLSFLLQIVSHPIFRLFSLMAARKCFIVQYSQARDRRRRGKRRKYIWNLNWQFLPQIFLLWAFRFFSSCQTESCLTFSLQKKDS